MFNSPFKSLTASRGQRTQIVLPGQQAVVSSVVVILELDHILLRVIILTGLRERMEI